MKSYESMLYLITNENIENEQQFLSKIEQAILGGVDILQFRHKTATPAIFFNLAKKLLSITHYYNIPFVINDRVEIARELKVGLHIGLADITLETNLSDFTLLGFSITNTTDMLCIPNNTTYLGIGPIFPQTTKKDAAMPMGLDQFKQLCNQSKLPVFGIGGINISNAKDVIQAGANGIAIISAIMDTDNSQAAAQDLKNNIKLPS